MVEAQEGGKTPVLLSFAQGANSLTDTTGFLGSGVHAGLVNPASLGTAERVGVEATHNRLFAGTAFNSLGLGMRLGGFGGLGVGFYRLTGEPAEKRNSQGDIVGSFRNEETVLKLGYGRSLYRLLPGLSLGGSVSLFRRSLDEVSNGFYVADAGLRYPLPFVRDLTVGLMSDNLVATTFGGTTDELVRTYRLGANYALMDGLFSVNSDVQIAAPLRYSFGVGYSPMSAITFSLATQQSHFAGGMRLKVKDYELHYNLGMHDLGNNHELGITLYFGKPDGDRRRYLEGLYRTAEQAVEKGNYASALKIMDKAARFSRPADKEKLLRDGLARLKEADIASVSGKEENAELIRRGISFYLNQKSDMAREIFQSALFKDPRNLTAKRLVAIAKGIDPKAPDAFQMPSFTDVDPIQLKLTKAGQYFQDQMWDLALKELREVIEMNPKETTAYVRLGSVYHVMGLKSKAQEAWQYAIDMDPLHPDVQAAKTFIENSKKGGK